MLLHHVGIINKSADEAVRFYGDFLGLDIEREYAVPAELTEQIFGIRRDIDVMVFGKEGVRFEVFICGEFTPASPDMMHVGLHVDDLKDVTGRAGRAGVEVITGKTKEKTVTFLRDYSGNLIEIKQK